MSEAHLADLPEAEQTQIIDKAMASFTEAWLTSTGSFYYIIRSPSLWEEVADTLSEYWLTGDEEVFDTEEYYQEMNDALDRDLDSVISQLVSHLMPELSAYVKAKVDWDSVAVQNTLKSELRYAFKRITDEVIWEDEKLVICEAEATDADLENSMGEIACAVKLALKSIARMPSAEMAS